MFADNLNPEIVTRFHDRAKEPEKYAGHSLFEIMGKEGDTKVIWDKNNPEEVESAKRQFDFLVKEKKYAAFHVEGDKGDKGRQMREFDPKAERIIFVPPMAGG